MSVRFPRHIAFGALHHATFRKQSPPVDGEAYKDFMRNELVRMKNVGLNTFNFNCTWSDMEVGDGQWDFSATDAVKEACDEVGLDYLLWLWPELTPPWFVRRFPQAMAVAASGYRTRSASPAHPQTRTHTRRFLELAVGRYGRHPRNLGYNIAVEGGLWWNQKPDTTNQDDRLWDYNEAAQAGFRTWLARKYGDLRELNRMWRSHFASFDDVEAPRARYHRDPAMLHNQVEWLDHRLFICDLYTDWMQFKVETVRALDAERPIVDHTHQVDPAFWAQDIWAIARNVDGMGVSLFTSDVAGDYMSTNWLMDRHRSAANGKPLWVWELRAGQTTWGITNWGSPLDAADIARFTWQVLANGATSVQYWNWRPHMGGVEVGGHGLADREGNPTPRAHRAGQIAQAVLKGPLSECRPAQAQIAIVDNARARIVAAGEGSDTEIVNAQRDCYAAWRSQGFAVDFVSEEQVAAGRVSPDRYRLLCVPFGYVLGRDVALALEHYVDSGGFLVAGLFCGMKDADGFGQPRVPGHGLDRVFGCREMAVHPCFSEADAVTSTLGSAYQIPMTGRPRLSVVASLRRDGRWNEQTTFTGYRFVETLAVDPSATVLAVTQAGEAVVVTHRHGKGRALYIGTLAGRTDDFADDGYARLLHDAAREAGVLPTVAIADRGDRRIDAGLLHGGTQSVLVVMNCEREAVDIHVTLPGVEVANACDYVDGAFVPLRNGRLALRIPARDARAVILDLVRSAT